MPKKGTLVYSATPQAGYTTNAEWTTWNKEHQTYVDALNKAKADMLAGEEDLRNAERQEADAENDANMPTTDDYSYSGGRVDTGTVGGDSGEDGKKGEDDEEEDDKVAPSSIGGMKKVSK